MSDLTDTLEKKTLDLGAVLSGVRQTQHTVDIYLRPDLVKAAFDLNASLVDAQDQDGKKPTKKDLTALEEARQAVKDTTLTVTLRSLADKEVGVIRDTVIRKNPITKGAGEEIRNLDQRKQVDAVNENLIAVSVIRIATADGAERNGLTVEDARALREQLPASEWDKLVDTLNEAQVELKALEQVMADSSFRWASADK